MDERYVRYQGRYKNKAPQRGDHLEKFQWKPGQSGNPKGKQTGAVSLVERLKAYLRRHPEEADKLVKELVKLALNKNMSQLQAIEKIMERTDGKVAETRRIEGELPIKILFVPAGQEQLEPIIEVEPAKLLVENQ